VIFVYICTMKNFVEISALPDGYDRPHCNTIRENDMSELCHLNRNISPQNAFFYLYRKFGAGNEFFDEDKTMACYLLRQKRKKDIIFEILIKGSSVSIFGYLSPAYLERFYQEETQAFEKYAEEVAWYAQNVYRRDALYIGFRGGYAAQYKESETHEWWQILPAYKKRVCRKYGFFLLQKGLKKADWGDFMEWLQQDFKDLEQKRHGHTYHNCFRGLELLKSTPEERQAERERVLAYYPPNAVLRQLMQAFQDLETFFRKSFASVRGVKFNFFGERE